MTTRLDAIKKRITQCTLTCDVCGSAVSVYTGQEGTSSYECVSPDDLRYLVGEVERLQNALHEYGQHNHYEEKCPACGCNDCYSYWYSKPELDTCTCGFKAALEAHDG